MSSASVVVVLPPTFDASIAATSSNPPNRLAMSPDGRGSPSSAVTTPTRSTFPSGAITTTRSWSGERPNDSGIICPLEAWLTRSGEMGLPYTVCAVITRNATGCIGTSVPGGSTGRWTPFCPPSAMKLARSE